MQTFRQEFMNLPKAVCAFQVALVQPQPTEIPILVTIQDQYQQNSFLLLPVFKYQTWYGATCKKPTSDEYTITYFETRRTLSDLSYYGNWNQLFSIMDQA